MSELKTVNEQVWSNIKEMPDKPIVQVEDWNPAKKTLLGFLFPRFFGSRRKVRAISQRTYGLLVAEATLYLRGLCVKKGDAVALLGQDSLEWMVINRAIQGIGAITVPLYANTKAAFESKRVTQAHGDAAHSAKKHKGDGRGKGEVDANANAELNAHILKDSGATVLLVDCERENSTIAVADFPMLKRALFKDVFANAPDYTGKSGQLTLNFRKEAREVYAVLKAMYGDGTMASVVKPEDVATLIYTSGSTSKPKGVIHTHGSLAASCRLCKKIGFDVNSDDIALHYLPFAHIYGLANGLTFAEFHGVVSCFATPETLKEEMELYRPTVLMGVPRVWNRIKDKVLAIPGLKGWLIRWALNQNQEHGLCSRIAEKVLHSVRKKMGADRIRLTLSGSAAIPKDTIAFFNKLGMSLREGYGSTESCGGISANTLTANKFGSLGKAPVDVEIRIVPRPGIDDDPNTGVLWVKGDFLFSGYWNLPEKTAAAFKEGWFNMGDIVRRDEDGYLWFVDRDSGNDKKLDTGEFYSDQRIQSAVEDNHSLILGCVVTGRDRPACGALIFLEPEAAKRIAGPAPAGTDSMQFFASNQAVRLAVEAIVNEANDALSAHPESKKRPYERVRVWDIVPCEPTVKNGLATATAKIKAEAVIARFKDLTDVMYARLKKNVLSR